MSRGDLVSVMGLLESDAAVMTEERIAEGEHGGDIALSSQ